MATSTFRKTGELYDRRGHLELIDKPLRLRGASWVEPGGAVVFFDDFIYDTLGVDWLASSTATGTAWAVSPTAGDPSAGHGGWIAALTDNVDASAEELGFGADGAPAAGFKAERAGNGMLVFEANVSKPTALTTTWCNVGLTDDPKDGANMAMSLTTTTWTTTATDAAIWGLYSTATDNDNWIGQTVDTNADGTHVPSTIAAAADTATRLRIELDSAGQAYFFQNDAFQGMVAVGTSPDVILTPYLAVGGTTTTSTALEADYVLVACGR